MVGTERAPRARGESKKESEYHHLRPGEKAPPELPFPEKGQPCPKCGHSDQMVWRPTFCQCHYCGFLKERPVEAMPITDELRREFRQKEMEITRCVVCDKRFERMAFYDSDLKDLCPVCRNRERSKQYKRERKGKGLFL